jgi:hypothetical protein
MSWKRKIKSISQHCTMTVMWLAVSQENQKFSQALKSSAITFGAVLIVGSLLTSFTPIS